MASHDATAGSPLASGAGVASVHGDRAAESDLAAPAGALRLRADHVPTSRRWTEGRDGGDGLRLPAAVYRARGHRANHARRISAQRHSPRGGVPARDPVVVDALTEYAFKPARAQRHHGVEPGRDLALTQVSPGLRVAGPRETAVCGPATTMVHAAVAHAQPGDVLVLTSTSRRPSPVGEPLATQACAGVAGCSGRRNTDLTSCGPRPCRSGRGSCVHRERRRASGQLMFLCSRGTEIHLATVVSTATVRSRSPAHRGSTRARERGA